MKTFEVKVREVHIQPYLIQAEDEEHAKDLIEEGGGEIIEDGFEYSHMMDKDTWEVMETDEKMSDSTTQKRVYLVMETERDDNGWIPCFAIDNESGYYRTNWRWDCTFEEAEQICKEKNEKLGYSEKDSIMVVVSSMRKIK